MEILPAISVYQAVNSNEIPSIHITFPNGHEDNMILQRHYSNPRDRTIGEKHCNYIGHLEKDEEACVAVTGCYQQEPLDFTINSKHSGHSNKFRLNINGDVESIKFVRKILIIFLRVRQFSFSS